MKIQLLCTLLVLVIPSLFVPLGTVHDGVITISDPTIQESAFSMPQALAKADDSYLDQWRSLRDSITSPQIDYEFISSDFPTADFEREVMSSISVDEESESLTLSDIRAISFTKTKESSISYLIERVITDGDGKVSRTTKSLDSLDLTNINMLIMIIPTGGSDLGFTDSELGHVHRWVDQGGHLIVVRSDVWDGGDVRLQSINDLLSPSGIRYDFSTIRDPTNFTGVASPEDTTPIFSVGDPDFGFVDGFVLPSSYTNSLSLSGTAVPMVVGDDDSYATFPFGETIIHKVGSHPPTAAFDIVGEGSMSVLSNIAAAGKGDPDNNPEFRTNFLSLLISGELNEEPNTILVDGNDDLAQFPGSGTADDPYVIENNTISYDGSVLIEIRNTDAHLLIRNNDLNGEGSQFSAMLLSNVTNAVVKSNTVVSAGTGITVDNSKANTVHSNLITGHTTAGVVVFDSTDITLSGNDISDSVQGVVLKATTDSDLRNNDIHHNLGNGDPLKGKGVSLIDSHHNDIIANNIYSNDNDGIFFQDSHENKVKGNKVFANDPNNGDIVEEGLQVLSYVGGKITFDASFAGNGMFFDPSEGNVISDNEVYDNGGMGIILEQSDKTIIDNNIISSNGLSGVFFNDSDDSTVTNNKVTGNGASASLAAALNSLNPYDYVTLASFAGNGMFFDPSFRNVVSGNTVSGNLGEGIILEFSGNTTIDDNIIAQNGLNGIMFIDSDDNNVTNNQVVENGVTVSSLIANAAFSPLEAKLFASFAGNGMFFDPSTGNIAEGNVVMENAGSGVFLLESSETDISNNQIVSNDGDGVMLINSSSNAVTSNLVDSNGHGSESLFASSLTADNFALYASFAGNGMFFDPSPDNTVSGNIVTNSSGNGIYFLETNDSVIQGNQIDDSGANGIFFQDSSHNVITENSLDNNGHDLSELALALDASFAGNGMFFDPSHFNVVYANNVSRSAEDGFLSISSSNTVLEFNRFIENEGYGLNLDADSFGFFVTENNFVDNVGVEKQGRDDGDDNDIRGNFYSDIPRIDEDYDGINDNPYVFEGDAENADETLSVIPLGLNFYEPNIEIHPRTLNVDSKGKPVKVEVYLADGFRALQVDPERFTLNGTIRAFKVDFINITAFELTFYRSEVSQLVKDAGIVGHKVPATFELHGRMNDDLLDLTAYDTIDIINTKDDDGKEKGKGNVLWQFIVFAFVWAKQNYFFLFLGLTGTLGLPKSRKYLEDLLSRPNHKKDLLN